MKHNIYEAKHTGPEKLFQKFTDFSSDFANICYGGYSQRADNVASPWINGSSKSTIKTLESD